VAKVAIARDQFDVCVDAALRDGEGDAHFFPGAIPAN
jgi:hypothetical protein